MSDATSLNASAAGDLLLRAQSSLDGDSSAEAMANDFALKEFESSAANEEPSVSLPQNRAVGSDTGELDLRVTVGQTMLSIDNVMQLRRGSIVKLDNAVEQSVQLFANERPVARGKLVEINGQFGVRIEELCHEAVGDEPDVVEQ